MANALRYECAKRRAVRIGYATYHVGEIAPRTRFEHQHHRQLHELARGSNTEGAVRSAEHLAAHERETAPLPDAVDVL